MSVKETNIPTIYGKVGQVPGPSKYFDASDIDEMIRKTIQPEIVDKEIEGGLSKKSSPVDLVTSVIFKNICEEEEPEKKGKDLGFGFNEDGYPLQDRYEFQDFRIAIENKKGSTRKWFDPDGNEKGSTKMHFDYGYIDSEAKGSDGEQIDVYIGPDEDAEYVFVIHQNKAPDFEEYDEDKVMIGFTSEDKAKKAYLRQYNDDGFFGGMSSMPVEKFREKVSAGGKITNESRIREERTLDLDLRKDIEEIVDTNKDKLEKIGVKVGRELGEGIGGGIVYDIGGGKALKVTTDESEAATSNWLKGKNLNKVVHIFDVFQFLPKEKLIFGIVEEKLEEIPENKKAQLDLALEILDQLAFGWETDFDEVTSKALEYLSPKDKKRMNDAISTIRFFEIDHLIDELQSHQVDWMDISSTNLMMRKGKVTAVDLGVSDSPESKVRILEKVKKLREADDDRSWLDDMDLVNIGPTIRRKEGVEPIEVVREGRSGRVGVTLGRYQPFHRGHSEVIRNLSKGFDKVIVLVLSDKKDENNPFSFETISNMISASLPDVISKIEVHNATFNGKPSTYIPGILSDISKNSDSRIEGDTAIEILVSQKQKDGIQKQIDLARKLKDEGEDLSFDPSLCIVKALSDVQSDDKANSISGSDVRETIKSNDFEKFKKLVDSHLVSNPEELRSTFEGLKKDLDVKENIEEALGSGIDIPDIMDTLDSAESLLAKKGIKIGTKLGSGTDGVVFDAGSGKVLKVTTDLPEAKASMMMMNAGNPSKFIAKFFDVFRFSRDIVVGGKDLYGILEEPLKKLSNSEKEEFDLVSALWLDPSVSKKTTTALRSGNFDQLLNSIREILTDYEKKGETTWFGEAVGDVTVKGKVNKKLFNEPTKKSDPVVKPNSDNASVEKKMKHIENILKKYNIEEMLKDLKSQGIQFSDIHSDNIMKRGDTFVINDLGRSGGVKGEIPVLEKIISNIMNEFDSMAGLRPRAGSSGWSTHYSKVDPNEEGLWQNQLTKLQLKGSSHLPK